MMMNLNDVSKIKNTRIKRKDIIDWNFF